MSGSPEHEAHPLRVDPSGKPSGSTRKVMGWFTFVSGLLFMGFDLYQNGGNNTIALAAYTGSGPTLYGIARANNEIQVRKSNGNA